MGWDGPPTLRHFQLWQAWNDTQRKDPDLLCYYIMQLTAELTMVTAWLGLRKKSDMPKTLEDLRLQFTQVAGPSGADPIPVSPSRKSRGRRAKSPEEKRAAQWSKMKWHAALGGCVTVRNPDGTLTLPDGVKVSEAEYNAGRTRQP